MSQKLGGIGPSKPFAPHKIRLTGFWCKGIWKKQCFLPVLDMDLYKASYFQ
jgi:hypothetical protein